MIKYWLSDMIEQGSGTPIKTAARLDLRGKWLAAALCDLACRLPLHADSSNAASIAHRHELALSDRLSQSYARSGRRDQRQSTTSSSTFSIAMAEPENKNDFEVRIGAQKPLLSGVKGYVDSPAPVSHRKLTACSASSPILSMPT